MRTSLKILSADGTISWKRNEARSLRQLIRMFCLRQEWP